MESSIMFNGKINYKEPCSIAMLVITRCKIKGYFHIFSIYIYTYTNIFLYNYIYIYSLYIHIHMYSSTHSKLRSILVSIVQRGFAMTWRLNIEGVTARVYKRCRSYCHLDIVYYMYIYICVSYIYI